MWDPVQRSSLRKRLTTSIGSATGRATPGDEEVLAWAFRQDRILVTLDKDFGELAVAHEKPHVGIIRLVGFSARAQAKVCLSALKRYGDELAAGTIVTVEPGRVRVRPITKKNGRSP